jgi:hypothetical protein
MSPGLRILTRVALILTGIVVVSASHAWGTEGHKVVALIAQSQLTPKSKAEVDQLLALEPGQTLASVSTWADEHKNPSSAPWHYVNFPRGDCVYDAQRDCPDEHCVVGVIQKELELLGSNASDAKRLIALKYLVHFVADVHQPLHAGFQDDKGGNKYQLQAFLKGSNLHAVWDSGLIKNLNEEPQAMADRLLKTLQGLPVTELNPVNAAQESCGIVSLKGFYPERLVTPEYVARYTPVLETRLATAGARLAGLLNAVFK